MFTNRRSTVCILISDSPSPYPFMQLSRVLQEIFRTCRITLRRNFLRLIRLSLSGPQISRRILNSIGVFDEFIFLDGRFIPESGEAHGRFN